MLLRMSSTPSVREILERVAGDLVVHPWKRYGHDRLYVQTADGRRMGYWDNETSTAVVDEGTDRDAFDAAIALYQASCVEVVIPAQAGPADEPAATIDDGVTREADPADNAPAEWVDLASMRPGAAAREQAETLKEAAPVRTFLARVLGVKTDERAWRIGADAEEAVASRLAKLGDQWRVLHAVLVGENGSDIDHVVIGPPGVITLNVKHHPRGKAWIGDRAVMVNGHKTDYLRNSRFEAQRSTRLLTAAGEPIAVVAAIVFVGLDELTIKQMPEDVHITTKRRLLAWLRSLPTTTSQSRVDDLHTIARLNATWTQGTNPSR